MSLPKLHFDERGLIPVVTQDAASGEILMLAYANEEALRLTLETRQAHYYSRSRAELWHKGATSGHTQELVEIRYDCDEDALLYRVHQTGAACHTGERSCFYRAIGDAQPPSMGEMMGVLERVIDQRLRDLPEGSYVTNLHEKGIGRVAQKVVEEAGESIVAALLGKREDLIGETADLLFHLSLLLRESDVGFADVAAELARRHKERRQ